MIKNLILKNDDSMFIVNNIAGFTKTVLSGSHLARLNIYGYLKDIPCKVSFIGLPIDVSCYKDDIASLSHENYTIESSSIFYCELNEKGYWYIHN